MRDIVLLKLAIIIEVYYSFSIVIKYSLLNKAKHPKNKPIAMFYCGSKCGSILANNLKVLFLFV